MEQNKKMFELRCSEETFTDKEGKTIPYDVFVLIVNGLAVRVRPVDSTAKLILKNALNS